MKTIYNIAAVILGTFLFLLLFPAMYILIQLALFVIILVIELLMLPLCIYLVYLAWKKVTNKQKTIN